MAVREADSFRAPRPVSGAVYLDRAVHPPQVADDQSIASLLGSLIADAQELMRKEIDLAKQEAKAEINKAKQGAISLGIGIGILAVGGLLLVLMLVHLLVALTAIPLWLSYLIVGGVLTVAGAVFVLKGKSRVSEVDPVPHETIESVRKDVEWIREQNPSEKI